jgi:hypothetical protein
MVAEILPLEVVTAISSICRPSPPQSGLELVVALRLRWFRRCPASQRGAYLRGLALAKHCPRRVFVRVAGEVPGCPKIRGEHRRRILSGPEGVLRDGNGLEKSSLTARHGSDCDSFGVSPFEGFDVAELLSRNAHEGRRASDPFRIRDCGTMVFAEFLSLSSDARVPYRRRL